MKKWFVVCVLAVAQFVMIIDGTVMNVSISTVARDLNTSITGMQTAITMFALTMAAFMLTGGKLGDILGRRKAFRIGSVIYGIGSLTTALSPSLLVLLLGWSLVEGLGAVLVIPAIAALAAANYSGKDRVVAFSVIGAATGLAAAVGPIIGGAVTTYFSWRYVFASETLIMLVVLYLSKRIEDAKVTRKVKLDLPSVAMSAVGMTLLVFGMLQSRSWGWIRPLGSPQINGHDITPLGISLVAYLVVAGLLVLKLFYNRQAALEASGKQPLLKVSMLKLPVLRSGLIVLMMQYFTIAAIFFIIPVYLQTILGYNALNTGLKLIPLSIGLLIFTLVGSKLTSSMPTRRIVRLGQLAMALGALFVFTSIDITLKGTAFWIGLFFVGCGFGLLASQLGNITMSAVDKSESSEVGGLQGTFQNLGMSFGTALVGSIFLLTLTAGFTNAINNNSSLSQQEKTSITQQSENGLGIVSKNQAKEYVIDSGGKESTAVLVSEQYQKSQLESLRVGMFFVVVSLLISLTVSSSLPASLSTRSR
ncbi:MAG TPA: MFS transporter [Candidatus Sulfotelmatobacter sp.]|nr:MFS transporter [Candidatus Sulfotelmatobacter sp.]